MNPSRPVARSRGSALLAIFVLVLVAGIVAFLAASWIAASKSHLVQQRWAETFGTREEVLREYPSRSANAAALELEGLVGRLGIDIATRSFAGRQRPSKELVQEHRRIKSTLGQYLNDQLERADRQTGEPPQELVAYLQKHRRDLEAVRRQLLDGDVPKWVLEIEKMWEAPIPNLLGHIDLHKLLIAKVLVQTRNGDRESALADLEASWRLNRSIQEDPILINQLISIAAARMEAGALRRIPEVPEIWRDRLFEHDFRASFFTALEFEGWIWAQLDNPALITEHYGDRPSGVARKLLATAVKPYFTFCLADVSDDYRERLENLTTLPALCDGDLAAHGADLNVPVPRWNLLGDIVVPNIASAVDRVRRLELDLELTAKVLELDRARLENGGVWPDSVAGILQSTACPDDEWVYRVSPEGRMTIRFSREISWPGHTGVILPTRFSTGR